MRRKITLQKDIYSIIMDDANQNIFYIPKNDFNIIVRRKTNTNIYHIYNSNDLKNNHYINVKTHCGLEEFIYKCDNLDYAEYDVTWLKNE